jgi:hypothetical protein
LPNWSLVLLPNEDKFLQSEPLLLPPAVALDEEPFV